MRFTVLAPSGWRAFRSDIMVWKKAMSAAVQSSKRRSFIIEMRGVLPSTITVTCGEWADCGEGRVLVALSPADGACHVPASEGRGELEKASASAALTAAWIAPGSIVWLAAVDRVVGRSVASECIA